MYKRKLRSMVELKEFLKNPSPKIKVPLYTEEDKQGTVNPGDKTMKKSKIDQLETRVNQLDTRMDRFESSFGKKMDRLETRIDRLAQIVKDGFKQVNERIDNLEKDVNSRLDRVDARLDYNGLKQLPENK